MRRRNRLPGGVYVWRTRKPGAWLGLPLIGRHFAYVGETTSFSHRERQHRESQPWCDLEPKVYRIRLPRWKPLLHLVETLLILLLWPVYNHKKNLWNPRQISLRTAKAMRESRDRRRFGWFWRLWLAVRWGSYLMAGGALLASFGRWKGWW
jgi:hypothetical protein